MEEQITALQKFIDTVIEFSVNYSFQAFGAVIVLIIGAIAARWLGAIVLKIGVKRKTDVTLSNFLAAVTRIIVLSFAIIIALGKFGITIAPFIAMIGAIAFGATYAVQGPLSNYGAGLAIILGRPFVVGDTITVAGVGGVVEKVELAKTTLVDEDGVKIMIPNKHVVGEILHNSKGYRVVESVIGISYDSDPDRAIETIKQTLAKSSDVAQSPQALIGIKEFADSSVNIGYRYWVPTTKYFKTSGAVNLAVFKALNSANIKIPFPQRDVHIISQTANV